MPNKQLTATVRIDSQQAEQRLKKIAAAIDQVNKAAGKSSHAYDQVEKTLNETTAAAKKVKNETDKVANSANKVNGNFKKVNNNLKQGEGTLARMSRSLRNMLSAYVGVMGTRFVLGQSDTITSNENRLNNIDDKGAIFSGQEQVEYSMDKIYSAAMRSRGSYGDMLNNVGKSMTLAGDAFGNDVDNAIKFQEIMSKAYTIGGASAAEQSSSMYQLIQALGSGVLQGDELRSVREGAPLAYKAIEKFAQGVLDTKDSLKDLASEGYITSDMVVAAIMAMENGVDNINDKFENTKVTFEQAGKMIGNMALQAFRPVLQMFNDILNSDFGKAFIDGIGKAFVGIANTILIVSDKIGNAIEWIVENWDWLKYVVIGVLSVMASYYTYSIALAIKSAVLWAIANWQMLAIYATIALLGASIVWLSNTTVSGCEFMIYALLAVGAAIALIGLIIGSTVVLTIGLVILAIALIVAAMAYCGEEIMAVIYTVGAIIYNVAVGLINTILQLCYSFAEPVLSIIEWILNVATGGFNSFGGAVFNILGQICSWFLSLGKVVTTIIDAIIGTDWTGTLNSIQDSVLQWGKKEDAITIQRDISLETMSDGVFKNHISRTDAADKGAETGVNIENWLSDFGSKVKDKTSAIGDGDLSRLLGTDKYEDLFGTNGFGKGTESYLPNIDSAAYGLGNYVPGDLLASIDGNTKDIKDSLDLRDDDLDFLRKIADMEWRKEFTTAEIKIDMTNHNTVNGDRDLDGIVEYLSEVLQSEMTAVAYGDHY